MTFNLKKVREARDYAELLANLGVFEKELREKYVKLCKTRIENIADDAVAFFIEDLLDKEPEEILGEK